MSDAECGVRMMGVGGTGVVTVSQVLGMAALIDGLQVRGLDQTGLSQKGGPVVSDLRISRGELASASKAPAGSVDVYLGFDLLGASADSNLATATPARTVAVVSTSAVPTGRMVIDPVSASPSCPASSTASTRSRAASSTSTSTPRGSPSGSSATT